MVDVSLIRRWLEECQGEHDHGIGRAELQAQLRATGRFRVIDVMESCLVDPHDTIDYIALSYVWGDALRERQAAYPSSWWMNLFEGVESDQLTKHQRRLRFENLPATIQDACELVKSIGWKYLWVDLLCICQDSPTEKESLVKQMHLLYEGASLTLVAAGGKSANCRLHGLHRNTRSPERVSVIPTEHGEIRLVMAKPALSDILSSTDWITRGWTFQEDILSSCCLYFTSNEIFYSCQFHLTQYDLRGVGDCKGFKCSRFSEWREGYVLETKYTKTASQSISQ